MLFSVVLMNKKCVKKCNLLPGITLGVGSVNSVKVNFDKKRSVSNEIPSEVEVSIVKMIVIKRDD